MERLFSSQPRPEIKIFIYSVGTSDRSFDEFLSLLLEHEIEAGVDVRSFPVSRFPHFVKEALQRALESSGIQYDYLGKELGGFRKGGYPVYMETESFRRGLQRLEEIGKEKRVAFFCSERFPWRCHRRYIAQQLSQRGWEVIHLIERGSVWIPKRKD